MTDEMKVKVEELLRDTEIAYNKSDIKRNNWYYSIASTALKENAFLLVGFNWGVGKGDHYEGQTLSDLTKNFRDLKEELGSVKRVYSKLKVGLSDEKFNNIVQTNFCFFRSEKEDQISKKDLDISSLLFDQLLHLLKPECILSFSKKLYSYLNTTGKLHLSETKIIISNSKSFEIAKGMYRIENESVPIYFLPHPNSKLSSEARELSWKFLFESLQN